MNQILFLVLYQTHPFTGIQTCIEYLSTVSELFVMYVLRNVFLTLTGCDQFGKIEK